MDRSRSGADFGPACLAVAAGLLVVALLGPWRRPEALYFFGELDRVGSVLAEQRDAGWEVVAQLLGLRERGDSPSGWAVGEGVAVAAIALLLAVAGLVLRRRGVRTAARLGPRAAVLALAAVALAGSLFAPWSDAWGGLDGWFHLGWSSVLLVVVAAGVALLAAAPPRRVHALIPLAGAVPLAFAVADLGDGEHLGLGFVLAAGALVVALIALSWPDRRRTL